MKRFSHPCTCLVLKTSSRTIFNGQGSNKLAAPSPITASNPRLRAGTWGCKSSRIVSRFGSLPNAWGRSACVAFSPFAPAWFKALCPPPRYHPGLLSYDAFGEERPSLLNSPDLRFVARDGIRASKDGRAGGLRGLLGTKLRWDQRKDSFTQGSARNAGGSLSSEASGQVNRC